MPLMPEILISTNAVWVPEGGTTNFQVKLDIAPDNPKTVTVSRVSGDADISVLSGGVLVFNTTTWSNNQTVTLEAAEDADALNSSATIRCSSPGLTHKDVTATEQDNDGVASTWRWPGVRLRGATGASGAI